MYKKSVVMNLMKGMLPEISQIVALSFDIFKINLKVEFYLLLYHKPLKISKINSFFFYTLIRVLL